MSGINWKSPSKPNTLPYSTPRPITASAVKVNLKDDKESEKLRKRLEKANWQREAWDYYDYIGEIKFSANLLANSLSKINLYVAHVADAARIPTPVANLTDHALEEYQQTIEEIFHLLQTGDGGPSGLLRDAALSMFVAGECYLVCEPGNPMTGTTDKWNIRSIDEIIIRTKSRRKQYFLKSSSTDQEEDLTPLPEDVFIARMWRSHPRYSGEADSSMRGVLEDCNDLIILNREARITSRSRSNAGLLFIPDEFDDTTPDSDADEESDGSDDNHDSIAESIAEALNGAAISEDHVNTNAPLVIRGPADLGDKIKLFTFNREIDPMYENLVEAKLNRILQGLDIPKDLAKGLSDLKYNSGALIEESLFRSHIEPLILMIVDQLTSGFLRPALRAQGVPDEIVDSLVIWYDPGNIMARPSKSEAANFGVTNNLVSGKAWRAANGFVEPDKISQEEMAQKLLLDRLVLDPQMANIMLNAVLPEVMNQTRDQAQQDTAPSDANALNNALGIDPATAPQDFESGDVQLTPEGVESVTDQGGLGQNAAPAPNSGPDLIEP